MSAYLKEIQKGKNDEIPKHPLGKTTFQTIKWAILSGLEALKRKGRGPLGQLAGTYTTNAYEIDQILIDAWEGVYEGNATSHKKLVADFMANYGEYVCKRKAEHFK